MPFEAAGLGLGRSSGAAIAIGATFGATVGVAFGAVRGLDTGNPVELTRRFNRLAGETVFRQEGPIPSQAPIRPMHAANPCSSDERRATAENIGASGGADVGAIVAARCPVDQGLARQIRKHCLVWKSVRVRACVHAFVRVCERARGVCVCVRARVCPFACVCVWGGKAGQFMPEIKSEPTADILVPVLCRC